MALKIFVKVLSATFLRPYFWSTIS